MPCCRLIIAHRCRGRAGRMRKAKDMEGSASPRFAWQEVNAGCQHPCSSVGHAKSSSKLHEARASSNKPCTGEPHLPTAEPSLRAARRVARAQQELADRKIQDPHSEEAHQVLRHIYFPGWKHRPRLTQVRDPAEVRPSPHLHTAFQVSSRWKGRIGVGSCRCPSRLEPSVSRDFSIARRQPTQLAAVVSMLLELHPSRKWRGCCRGTQSYCHCGQSVC